MKHLTLRRLMMAAMAGIALMAGCDKEEQAQDNHVGQGAVRLVAEQSEGTKTSVSGTSVLWADGDHVRINGVNCPLVVSNNGQHAEIDFDNSGTDIIVGYPTEKVTTMRLLDSRITINVSEHHDYSVDANGRQHLALPMVGRAGAGESSVTLKHLCGMVSVTITNNTLFTIDLRRVLLRSSDRLTGTLSDLSLADMDNFAIDPQASSDGSDNTVQVTFDGGALPLESGASRVVAVPALPCRGFEVEVVFTQGTLPGLKTPPQYSYRRTSTRTLHRAEVLAAEVNITMASQYVAPSGGFVVNEAGDRVYFSQGNLRYQRTDRAWSFAENQYDYIGDGNTWTDPYAGPVLVDLFGWGTSGWNPSGSWTGPGWVTSPTAVLATDSLYTPGGSWENDLTGSCAEADWAWHNPISNGGNRAHLWRVLTKYEWDYLLAHHGYSTVTVNNTMGLLLLPDGWESPFAFQPFALGIDPSWPQLTSDQWSLLEASGAIFLPCAGHRDGDSFIRSNSSTKGEYWTSSNYSFTSAYSMQVYRNNMSMSTTVWVRTRPLDRHYGASVRPVIDASRLQ